MLAPVMAGLCRFESLKDGSMDLADVALLNDALTCKYDNEYLARKREEKKDGQG